ncbi:MAG: hypothetical protein ACREOK_13375 [Gemmatimonadaceae bacterium]
MLPSGRIVFAIALIGLGVVSLIFRDFVHNLQPVDLLVSTTTPGYRPFALASGMLLIVAGVLIMLRVRAYDAAIALAVFLMLWIVFLQVPSAVLNPRLLRSPWWVRTFEVLAMTGALLILAGHDIRPTRERLIQLGRVLFGVSLPVFGVLHFIYASNVASLIPAFYPFPLALAYITGAAKIAAGAAIVLGKVPRQAAGLTALLYGVYALTLHIPRQIMEPSWDAQRAGLTSMFVAIAFCGAALIVAGSLERRARDSVAADGSVFNGRELDEFSPVGRP